MDVSATSRHLRGLLAEALGSVSLWLGSCIGLGQTYTLLHQFAGGFGDGATPYAGLALSGNTLYGTTQSGGSEGAGTIFSVNRDGSGYAVLHQFGSLYQTGTNYPNAGGAAPCARLLPVGSYLYGTTYWGGSGGYGTVFKINTNGTEFTVLKEFSGPDGINPTAALTASGTTLYGTTWEGGSTFLPAPVPHERVRHHLQARYRWHWVCRAQELHSGIGRPQSRWRRGRVRDSLVWEHTL